MSRNNTVAQNNIVYLLTYNVKRTFDPTMTDSLPDWSEIIGTVQAIEFSVEGVTGTVGGVEIDSRNSALQISEEFKKELKKLVNGYSFFAFDAERILEELERVPGETTNK